MFICFVDCVTQVYDNLGDYLNQRSLFLLDDFISILLKLKFSQIVPDQQSYPKNNG